MEKIDQYIVRDFADRLIERLDQKGLTQNQLALAIGVSRSTVTGWLRYNKLPDSGILARVCRILGCTADWLLGLESHLEKSDAAGGIRWIEQIPPYVRGFQREQIENGIRLFNMLVNQAQPDTAIITDHNLSYLQYAIQAAFRSGAIRLVNVMRDAQRESEIRRLYPTLKDIVVAAVPAYYDGTIIRAEMVSFLAATQVLSRVVRESVIGLGTGYTILRLCEQSIPSVDQFKGTKWLPLVTYTDDNASGYTANQLARFMQIRHPGSEAVYLPHPSQCLTDSAMQAEFNSATRLIGKMQTLFLTVSGVGRRDRTANSHPLTDFRTADYAYDSAYLRDKYAELNDKDRFGGELLSYLIDVDGNIISWDQERVWQVDLDVLRYNSDLVGRVCLVAARHYKAKAVQTCIQNGLANALVIDTEIADTLIGNAL